MNHRDIAEEYIKMLQENIQQVLVSVVLFGSVAKEKHNSRSDIDLLVLLNSTDHQVTNIIQQITDMYQQDVKLSVNVVSYSDYIQHVMIGDPFSVVIAKEGECLLKSKPFEAAQILVKDTTNIADKDILENYLKQTVAFKAQDILDFGLPKLLEELKYTITYFLLKHHLKEKKIILWEDVIYYSKHKNYMDDFLKLENQSFLAQKNIKQLEDMSVKDILQLLKYIKAKNK